MITRHQALDLAEAWRAALGSSPMPADAAPLPTTRLIPSDADGGGGGGKGICSPLRLDVPNADDVNSALEFHLQARTGYAPRHRRFISAIIISASYSRPE